MDIELGSRFRLFQPGRATLTPSYFLCVFWDESNNMTRPCLAQTIGDTLGPIVLELTEMGSPNYEDAEVELYAGDWQLTVYEQTSSTNYDPALSGREVWSELVRVNEPDTPPAPRQPYNGPIVPDANRVCIVPCVYGTPTDGQVIGWNEGANQWQPQTAGGGGGTGDVTGPASATNNNFASFNLTTGKVIKDSGSNAASFDAAGAASAAQAAAIAAAASDATTKANAAQAAAIASAASDATTKANAAQAAAIASASSDATTKANAAQAAAIAAAASDATTKANAAQAAAQAASDPVGSAAAAQAAAIAASQPASDVSKAALAAQFDTSSASYVDVTGFSVTLAANSNYYIDFYAVYRSPATTTGAGISLSFTNAPTVLMEQTRRVAVAGTNSFGYVTGTDTGAGIGTATTAGSTATNLSCRTSGTVKTGGSASVMQVRFARGGTSNTVSMMAGMSTINAHKI